MNRFMSLVLGLMILLIASMASAADPTDITVVPAEPGVYTINNDSVQQTVGWYPLIGADYNGACTVVNNFNSLTKSDGRTGSSVKLGHSMIDGEKVFAVVVTATPAMHQTIKDQLASLTAIGFAPATATRTYRPKHRPAEDIANAVTKGGLTGIGFVHFDKTTNVVVVDDIPGAQDYILESWIQPYDVPANQANVTVTIVELSDGTADSIGIYWDAWKQALPSDVSATINGSRDPINDRVKVTDFSAIVSGVSPQALAQFVNYLQTEGVADIRSKTTVAVVNAKLSVFRSGTDVPYQALTATDGNNTLTNASVLDGIEVTIDPLVADQTAALSVHAIANSVTGFSANGMPVISTSSVATELSVDRAEAKTFVLSGLKRTEHVNSRIGIPLLKDIPLVQLVASWKQGRDTTKDVMILLQVGAIESQPNN